jgi:hypothetical protein
MSPADIPSVQSIFTAVWNMIGVIVLLVIYSYIDKLEKINCDCAVHPNQKFIKNYIVFAVVFLLITAFLPPSRVNNMFGPMYVVVYQVLTFIFAIATFVFYIIAMRYARYLMVEKCKCSEDMRREVMYVWSLLMVVLFVLLVVVSLGVGLAQGAAALALTTGKTGLKELSRTSMEVTSNPIKSLRRVPKSLEKSVKQAMKIGRK